MKKYNYIIIAMILSLFSSCMLKGPAVNSSVLVTKNPVGSKTGIAERTIWFGIWLGNTDLSIASAAKKGKITKIATVDREVYIGFLGIKKTYKTIVTGTNDEIEEPKKGKKKRRTRSRKRK